MKRSACPRRLPLIIEGDIGDYMMVADAVKMRGNFLYLQLLFSLALQLLNATF